MPLRGLIVPVSATIYDESNRQSIPDINWFAVICCRNKTIEFAHHVYCSRVAFGREALLNLYVSDCSVGFYLISQHNLPRYIFFQSLFRVDYVFMYKN